LVDTTYGSSAVLVLFIVRVSLGLEKLAKLILESELIFSLVTSNSLFNLEISAISITPLQNKKHIRPFWFLYII
jgi:hypothetical protein